MMNKNMKKVEMDENMMEQVNGGYIVSSSNCYFVTDDDGKFLGNPQHYLDAEDLAKQYGASTMSITFDEWDQVQKCGYFYRDGIRYYAENGTVKTM